ncbi:hypothetical protein [Ralstonia flatus]|uniref:Uncharacterized protein n=1 Tax=Ralstonia flatus TaxID=3058601 RepID=A0ABM9KZL0_9RALS|nr:hypothetical protein [Ralstonia sp. LMG 32965]MBN6209448.1 hypothetical protein [Ralstonia pickettii]CAJ0893321.1 hypothetical protein R77564_03702 [Ralstonia sp. LMG 32965]
MNAISKTPLRFFQDAIPDLFKADSNADIGEVFIALVYPQILIWDGRSQYTVDCRQDGFLAEQDSYPLLALLEQFPSLCEAILAESPGVRAAYARYLRN